MLPAGALSTRRTLTTCLLKPSVQWFTEALNTPATVCCREHIPSFFRQSKTRFLDYKETHTTFDSLSPFLHVRRNFIQHVRKVNCANSDRVWIATRSCGVRFIHGAVIRSAEDSTSTDRAKMVRVLSVAEKNDAAKNLAEIMSRGGYNRVSIAAGSNSDSHSSPSSFFIFFVFAILFLFSPLLWFLPLYFPISLDLFIFPTFLFFPLFFPPLTLYLPSSHSLPPSSPLFLHLSILCCPFHVVLYFLPTYICPLFLFSLPCCLLTFLSGHQLFPISFMSISPSFLPASFPLSTSFSSLLQYTEDYVNIIKVIKLFYSGNPVPPFPNSGRAIANLTRSMNGTWCYGESSAIWSWPLYQAISSTSHSQGTTASGQVATHCTSLMLQLSRSVHRTWSPSRFVCGTVGT